MTTARRLLTTAALALSVLAAVPQLIAQQASDQQIQADAQKQLSNKRYSGIQIHVENGIVHLTGDVERYAEKADAQKRIEKMHEAAGIRNDIRVTGGENISDAALYQKLAKALVYDRQGYPDFPFNSFTLQVHDGVVVVGGVASQPIAKDSALSLIDNTPGVRDVVDHIQVAPVSPMDDRIRLAEFRAVYGAPQLNHYAIDPSKPIRIVVVNGHVTLTGVVDNKGDRDVAGIRANGVPGVFSVQNDIQVAGQNEH